MTDKCAIRKLFDHPIEGTSAPIKCDLCGQTVMREGGQHDVFIRVVGPETQWNKCSEGYGHGMNIRVDERGIPGFRAAEKK